MDNTFDSLYYSKGQLIGGIDESGVGDIAGPLVAACVILPIIDRQRDDLRIFDVNDSKIVPPLVRQKLADVIINTAIGIGIGETSPQEIDYLGKSGAIQLAMKRAVAACKRPLSKKSINPDFLLIDGDVEFHESVPHLNIVSGDNKSLCIASASIIAKVWRDNIMLELHNKFPFYGWDSNKGWPCVAHFEGLDKYGVQIGIHRLKGWPFSPGARYKGDRKEWLKRHATWKQKTKERLYGL